MKEKKNLSIIKTLLLIVILAVVVIIAGVIYQANNKTKVTAKSVSNTLSRANTLTTMTYHYTRASRFDNTLAIDGDNLPKSQSYYLITYDGILKLGVDLKKAKVSLSGDTISVNAGKLKVISHEIDEKSVDLYNESANVFTAITIKDQKGFEKKQKQNVINDAKGKGLYKEARAKARSMISTYLKAVPQIKSNYKVVVKVF